MSNPSRVAIAMAVVVLINVPVVMGYQLLKENEDGTYDVMTYGALDQDTEDPTSDPYPIVEVVETETDGLNKTNDDEVQGAVLNISDAAVERATGIRDALRSAGNLSNMVRAAYRQANPNATLDAQRTNLSTARGLTGLGDVTVALYKEANDPLTASEELQVRQQASNVPSEVAKAAAVMTYAVIDAKHYVDAALAGVDVENRSVIDGNESLMTMLHRRMEFSQDGNTTVVGFADNTTKVLNAAGNVTGGMDGRALFHAMDVLAQALDEIRALDIHGLDVPGEVNHPRCAEEPLVFADDDCRIVIGPTSDTTYKSSMVSLSDGDYELNAVLLDLGGDDRYENRAGGGYGAGPIDTVPVQVNVDIGTGADVYDRFTRDGVGPAQGSGILGAGLLFDAGGDDHYLARAEDTTNDHLISQGSGEIGAGMLIDQEGNDLYVTHEPTDRSLTHGQGAALLGGFGLMRDLAGEDTYFFNLTDKYPNGGGAQAYADLNGTAYLLDWGTGDDLYRAGQDLVQAAASAEGFAFFHDEGGNDRIEIQSYPGCPELRDDTCAGEAFRPQAGWGQAYADLAGYAVLMGGPDAADYHVLDVPDATDRSGERRFRLGSGNTTGAAIFVDPAGNDTYDAVDGSHGYGNIGLGIFVDQHGTDSYACEALQDLRCYGFGTGGFGVFAELGDSQDAYTEWDNRTSPWAFGDLGLGVR